MSQAAAERQAELDQKKAAWQQRTQAGAPAATHGDAASPTQQLGDHAAPSQQTADDGAGDDGAASRVAEEGAAGDASASAEDASSSSSEAEEDGEVDVAKNAQVCHGRDCWIMCMVKLLFSSC